MQSESEIQINLREKIQTFLFAFREENDLGNIIPDCIFLYSLIKKGIIINQSQLPDLYSKLQIPIDKRKAFCCIEYEVSYSEKDLLKRDNCNNLQGSYFNCKIENYPNFTTDFKFQLDEKQRIKKFFKYKSKPKEYIYKYSKEILLFPQIPFRINVNSNYLETETIELRKEK